MHGGNIRFLAKGPGIVQSPSKGKKHPLAAPVIGRLGRHSQSHSTTFTFLKHWALTLRHKGSQQEQLPAKDFTTCPPSLSPVQTPPGAGLQQAEAPAADHGLKLLQLKEEVAAPMGPSCVVVVVSLMAAGWSRAG